MTGFLKRPRSADEAGVICFCGQLLGEGMQGLGRGAIRVKIVPIK